MRKEEVEEKRKKEKGKCGHLPFKLSSFSGFLYLYISDKQAENWVYRNILLFILTKSKIGNSNSWSVACNIYITWP